ncbi:MAG: hypothetical protein AAGA46_03175 [Cyanobacteria bacterium P01_F01_bin.13]
MLLRTAAIAGLFSLGVALPARAVPVCYIELSGGAMYNMNHLCISEEGSQLINTARGLRQQSDDLEAFFQADRDFEQGRVENAQIQQNDPYASREFWQSSQEFWQREVVQTDRELARFGDINRDINYVQDVGVSLRLGSGPDARLQDLSQNEMSPWEWAVATSGN